MLTETDRLCTVTPCIYSILTFRRLLKYEDYHHPGNVKQFGFSTNELELGNAVQVRAGPHNDLPTEYAPPAVAIESPHPAVSTNFSVGSSMRRASTAGSVALGRRESYNHKRDTQFDDYLVRRRSSVLQDDVERAMMAEFGWVGGGQAGVERSESFVRTGVVTSARARPRSEDFPVGPSVPPTLEGAAN